MNHFRLSPAAGLASLALAALLHGEPARAALTLDAGFDADGIAEVDVATGPDLARDVAAQADGGLVLAGRSRQTNAGTTIDYVVLTRLDGLTGALDATFGTAGKVTFLPGLTAASGGGGDGRALVIQPVDQKIVVTGTWKPDAAADTQVFVARLDSAGALDPAFGTDGVVLLTPAGVTSPQANAIALRSDGSIVVAGNGTAASASVGFVTALDSAGDVIPGFTDAVVEDPLAAAGASFGFNAVAVLPGDGILAGGGGGDLTLAQFTSTGAPDSGFDGDGIASFNFLTFDNAQGPNPSYDVVTALAVLGDGRILMAGRAGGSSTSTATNRVLGRVTAAGVLDTTFGSGGYAPLGDAGVQEVPGGLGVRPSGDIVLAGQGFPPTQVSPNGIAVVPVSGTFTTELAALEVLADGDVAAAGQRTVSGANTALAAVRLDATDLPDGPDTVPDPFLFTTQTGLETGFTATSNTVTITGLNAPAPISVSTGTGDAYSIGCSTFTTSAGTVSDGDTVCVRSTSATTGEAAKSAFLTIGGVVSQFTLVTGDATPAQFTFVDQTAVPASTAITSEPITLTDLAIRTDVSVVGGTYSVGCTGTFTASVTTVDPGAEICVRHTSSPSPGGVTNTTLRAGKGTTIQDVFTSTTEGDITPDAFNFVDQTGVARSTEVVSASVTLTGFDGNAQISVSGGEYSVGCTGAFTAVTGTVGPDATVCVRHTSSAIGGTATNTTLTVGAGPGLTAVSDTFTSTTEGAPDTTPEPFSFVDQTSVPLASQITSGVITIGGYDTSAPISVTGGVYSVGCTSTFTASSGQLPPGSTLCVRHASPATTGTATNTVLTVGGVSDTFTSTTLAGDATPETFSFTDQTGVDLSDTITSAPVTVTGIDVATPIAVSGGEYSIGCTSSYTTDQGNITNGQTVCVRHESAFDSNSSVNTSLAIGTVTDTFTSTTRDADQTPDDFSFPSQTGAGLGEIATSDEITVAGVDSPVQIFLSGPRDSSNRPLYGYSTDCTGDIDGTDGDVLDPGTTLCIIVLTAATDSTSVVVTVTIGGNEAGSQKTATFTVTTGETVPDAFTFTDRVGVAVQSTVYADPVTITGITGPSRVEISQNGQFQIDCTGDFTGGSGLVENGQTICVRHVSASSLSTLTDTVLTVGGVSDTFTSTTTADSEPLPGSSAMDAWSLLLLAPLAAYRRRRRAL